MGLNLTNTRALQSASQMWVSAVNTAYVKTLTGSTSLDQAVKLSVREMGRQGAYVTYVSDMGRVTKTSLEVAVRRDVVTSVNQAASELTMGRCDEYECDLVEVSHEGARPEHAAWQGKVYSLHGKTPGYELLSVATGYGEVDGLMRGKLPAFILSPTSPAFPSSLKIFPARRRTSRPTRRHRSNATLSATFVPPRENHPYAGQQGDSEGSARAQARVGAYQSKMREFIDNSGLTRQYPREQIYS